MAVRSQKMLWYLRNVGLTAIQYHIPSVPTLMLFRNEEVLWRTSGVVGKTELLVSLNPYFT